MCRKVILPIVVSTQLWAGITTTASAAMIGTRDALLIETRAVRISEIQANLARHDIQQALVNLGVDPEHARFRVASLNDQELAQLDGKLDDMPAAGSVLALVGAVFVVLLILELTGAIDIFKKT